jgi:HAD superfamily hydrolase (TIGR01509 family)
MVKPLPHVHARTWLGHAVLFDLDGVLVDAAGIHRQALREALEEAAGLSLTAEEEAALEGLPTRVKLDRLYVWHSLRNLDAIAALKQERTALLLEQGIRPDPDKCQLVRDLAKAGYAIGVVSNAVSRSVTRMLQLADLVWPMSIILSNETVPRPKPAPDGWTIAMYELGTKPANTLIVEDSVPGIESAYASGAHVLEVAGPQDVTVEKVQARLDELGWAGLPVTAAA